MSSVDNAKEEKCATNVEWAIMCSRSHDLDELGAYLNLDTTRSGRLGELQTNARDATIAAFGPPRFTRLYYGVEFCERLVPAASQVRRAYEAATCRRLSFSLLTPYVTDAGLGRLWPLFEWLAALDDSSAEVVVNDWGVLHLLRRDFPRLRPVLGRLMNRMLRDPRIAGEFASPQAPAAALQVLRQSGVTAALFRRFLGQVGITMVEFDNLLQGLDMNFREFGLSASLYCYRTLGGISCYDRPDYMASQTRLNYAHGYLPSAAPRGTIADAPVAALPESGTY